MNLFLCCTAFGIAKGAHSRLQVWKSGLQWQFSFWSVVVLQWNCEEVFCYWCELLVYCFFSSSMAWWRVCTWSMVRGAEHGCSGKFSKKASLSECLCPRSRQLVTARFKGIWSCSWSLCKLHFCAGKGVSELYKGLVLCFCEADFGLIFMHGGRGGWVLADMKWYCWLHMEFSIGSTKENKLDLQLCLQWNGVWRSNIQKV